jgi:putative oxidoreductase
MNTPIAPSSNESLGLLLLRIGLGLMWIVLGVYGRQASLLLMPILLVAAWVHLPNGWVHTSNGGGWEYPVFLAIASTSHWLLGDGRFSICRSKVLALS